MTRLLGPLSLCLWLAACSGGGIEKPQATADAQPVSKVTSAFENLLIKVPGSAGDQAKVFVVQQGVKHWVVNASWMAPHGYKFPQDVREISVADFEKIPTGEPIQ